MSNVGEEVRRLREAKGWGQAKLAVESGMAVSGISQLENGKRNPTSATLAKVARALEVEVRDLFPKAQNSLPLEEAVSAPLDMFRIQTEVLKTIQPQSAEELKEAMHEAGAHELLTRYEPEDLHELEDELREARTRIHERPRASFAEVFGENAFEKLTQLQWNLEAIEYALEHTRGAQLAGAAEEENEQ